MPVPEGVDSNPPGGLQDPLADGIINPSEREEVVIVPLYGIIHDSPAITAVQKVARRKTHVAYINENDAVGRLFAPLLAKVQDALDQAEEQKKKK
jgi:hypothetical protein